VHRSRPPSESVHRPSAPLIESGVRRTTGSCSRRPTPPEGNGTRATPSRSSHDFDIAGTRHALAAAGPTESRRPRWPAYTRQPECRSRPLDERETCISPQTHIGCVQPPSKRPDRSSSALAASKPVPMWRRTTSTAEPRTAPIAQIRAPGGVSGDRVSGRARRARPARAFIASGSDGSLPLSRATSGADRSAGAELAARASAPGARAAARRRPIRGVQVRRIA
jgi:hypothetical protein